jgi:hypothetical protein
MKINSINRKIDKFLKRTKEAHWIYF